MAICDHLTPTGAIKKPVMGSPVGLGPGVLGDVGVRIPSLAVPYC
jgi:hypothetical protein